MKKIFELLDKEKINYRSSFDKKVICIGKDPIDIRVSKDDTDLLHPINGVYPHTGVFYYEISWINWNKTFMKHEKAKTPQEALKKIRKAMDELGVFEFGDQMTLF